MLNPSNLYDLNIGWALMHDQFMRRGDAWVGITAKPIDVQALKTFDPKRYGSLSFANPLPLSDPRNCTDIQTVVDPPALRSRTSEDGLIWDIYSQVGAWLKSGTDSNPLTYGHRHSLVQEAYGFGYSQTGCYLIDYINAIHPLVVKSDGRPIYNGYPVGVSGGDFVGTVPINQCSPAPAGTDPRARIHDVGVPVIQVMSQSDYLLGIAARRPDGNRAPDQFRHYEMAGAAHATPDELEYSGGDIDVVNGAPVLDRFGNVSGGLRSPFVDVPTSTWFGSSTGPGFCFIVGHVVPLDPATPQTLYATHGTYVRDVTRDVLTLVAQRYLTLADGLKLIHEAQASDVP